MSLFQKSVLKKHLQTFDKAVVEAAWQRYAGHFLDVAKQENIRNSKAVIIFLLGVAETER